MPKYYLIIKDEEKMKLVNTDSSIPTEGRHLIYVIESENKYINCEVIKVGEIVCEDENSIRSYPTVVVEKRGEGSLSLDKKVKKDGKLTSTTIEDILKKIDTNRGERK